MNLATWTCADGAFALPLPLTTAKCASVQTLRAFDGNLAAWINIRLKMFKKLTAGAAQAIESGTSRVSQ